MNIRILVAICFFAFIASSLKAQAPFITTWKTDNLGSSNSTSITIPTEGSGYLYDVDWENDGIYDDFGVTGNITHDYGVAGTYQVAITGDFPRIRFTFQGDPKKILSIDQWGDIEWQSMGNAFNYCIDLIEQADDIPNLSNTTDCSRAFLDADNFNGGLDDWDVSTITDMSFMFNGAHNFDSDIGNWDVSSVTNMSYLFLAATSFSHDIGSWDVSSVTNMSATFYSTDLFNHDIGSWDVSSVTNMKLMFFGNDSFNQDIGSWDVSSVLTMSQMFRAANNFNQNLGDWNISSVTNMFRMLENSDLSIQNYDSTLIGWADQNTNNNIVLGADGLEYCNGEVARNNLVNNHGWVITDSGLNCPCTIPTNVVLSTQQQIDDFATDYPFCTEIVGNLTINDTNAGDIINLDGLSQLISVGGFLKIESNSALVDISGLENIDPTSISNANGEELTITNNVLLSVCDNQFICDFITLAASDSDLTTFVQNNNTGCNSEAEVETACAACTPPTVTFTAPADLCIDAGVQSSLGNGTPTGGIYSGPGVTDDSDGMTYSFNLAAAGVGVHTLTYTYTDTEGCTNSASDEIEVFNLPAVTFSTPANLCIDAGIQVGLGDGTPTGGLYYGTGVTDDGNGMTYSFDPAVAGAGFHNVIYDYTDTNGCTGGKLTQMEVYDLPIVSYSAPADLCMDSGIQVGLGGATPTLGVYTGSGITDDGNGVTYSFDPTAAGVGIHTLTYYYTDGNGCMSSASDDIEVFDLPTVTFTALADLCVDGTSETGLTGGSPAGGIYSGAGVTDNGDDTYDFSSAAAGIGVHTLTYTYTDTNGCTASATDQVEVFDLPTVTFAGIGNLCIDAGVQINLGGATPIGGLYYGAGVTDDGNGMTYSFDPAAAGVGFHNIVYEYTDANGCVGGKLTSVEVYDLPVLSFTAAADLCIDAGVQVGLGGATPTLGVYTGSGITDDGNGVTYSFDPTAAGVGIHTLTYYYTDGNGCMSSASDDIEVFDLPTVTFTALADLCVDGTSETGLSGGSPIGGIYSGAGVTDNGDDTYDFSSAAAGIGVHTLTYTYTDTDGCTASATDQVEVFDLPTVTFAGIGNLCIDAGVQINLGGATPIGGLYYGTGVTDDGNGMTYSFDPAAAGVGPHNIIYEYTDSNGCTGGTLTSMMVFDLSITYTSTNTICNNNNGMISATVNANTGIVNYSLSGNPVTMPMMNLAPGTYQLDATDDECTYTEIITIAPSDPLDITAIPIATTCDLDNGEVSFVVNTGTTPITYSDNGTTITSFTGLADGIYTWDAEDANGCMFTTNFTIGSSIALTINTTPVSTFCDGNNGSVTGTMITGNGSATYTLNGNVNNTGVFTGLAPGTYTMTATDQLFCTASSTFTINGSAPLQISTVVTPTFCNEDNGSITATLNSGTSPVNYTIAGQGTNTSGTFTDLAPGTYILNAVDAVGCQATETFTINPSAPLDINTVIVSTTCELDNGSVTATLMSGTTPVTFTIAGQGSNTTGQFIDLAPGTYTMNAADADGCQASVTIEIDDSTLPLFDMEVVRTSCGDVNGSIQLTPDVNTGRAPYEFNIGTGWTSDYVFDNLLPDNYTVTIRDADGCTTSQSTTILDSEQLVFINHIDHADCKNISGIITLIALEGTGPFLYSISNEFMYRQNDFGVFSFVEAGQYTATVIGEDGCVVTQKLNVENDPGVRLDVEVTHPACGETDGSLQFNLGKTGTAPYQIFVDGALVEDSLYADYLVSDLANGDYKVEVFDFHGCSDYAEITINDGNSIVEELIINSIDCEGNPGSISTIIGDPGTYTFTLNGETNSDGSFSALEAGRYTYTATDSMGCDYTKEIEIFDNSFTDVRVLVINDDCEDLSNIKIIPENGNGPYRYFVNGKQYFENGAKDLTPGFYTVEVIDANGCIVTQEIKVEGESKFTYSVEKCRKPKFGKPGFLVVQAISGEGPYIYQLDEYTSSKGLFVNLYKETYTLTITDIRGCSSSFKIDLCGAETFNKELSAQRRNNELSDVSIYPNPGVNILNIEHGSEFENQKIEVYGSAGQLIKQISINPESTTTTINTQEWSKGIYFIKIGSTRMIKWFKA